MKVKYDRPGKSRRWALLKVCDIPSAEDPTEVYLRRLRVVQTPWFGIYVHWINEPDKGRHLHNHPWTFWRFIVRGGYIESFSSSVNTAPVAQLQSRWSLSKMPIQAWHTIVVTAPHTMSIVLVGRRRREFQFLTESGPIDWREYEASREPDIEV